MAEALGARSVAFPAISTGVFGFPPEPAARIAVDTVSSAAAALDIVRLVRLVAFDGATFGLYVALLRASSPPTRRQ